MKMKKPRYSIKDHLIAYLVLIVIICLIVLGAFVLYKSGLFEPVVEGHALHDTVPLQLGTPTPTPEETDAVGKTSLWSWLFATASAEGAPVEEAPGSEDELEQLLAEIVAEENGEQEVAEADRVDVDKADLAINQNLPTDVYNVLLLATDSRDINANNGRSDVIIIASVNMATNEIKLTSISRDLFVEIPGVGPNKINAAHAYGGPLLAMKTVNANFEMNMQDYAVVNFQTMASIVDALGGVDIYLEGMEYYYINYNVAVSEDYEGFAKSTTRRQLTEADADTSVHLDGLQGVSYARIRKLDNDFQRGSRQRILLQAMMDKAMENLSMSTFYGLANSMLNSTSTNIKLTTVMDLGTWILSADSFPSMEEMSVPIEGSYRSDMEKDMSVVKFNQQQNVEALHTFIYGEYIPAKEAQ